MDEIAARLTQLIETSASCATVVMRRFSSSNVLTLCRVRRLSMMFLLSRMGGWTHVENRAVARSVRENLVPGRQLEGNHPLEAVR